MGSFYVLSRVSYSYYSEFMYKICVRLTCALKWREMMASLLTCRGKLYFDVKMKRAKNTTTKKKGREEDELAFKGTVEPFYSSAHPVTPAVLYRYYSFRFVINCAFRYHLCDEYDSLSLTL